MTRTRKLSNANVGVGALALLCCFLHASLAFAQEDVAQVVGSNSQVVVDGFDFQTPTNAAFFSGPSVSAGGWVFFTMGVKETGGAGLGDALFASNGGLTQVLLGPEELGAERRIPETIELRDVPKVRATGRDTVLIRATVAGTDGLWEISPADATAELVAEEGVDGITSIGVNRSNSDQFWGDKRGLVYFRAEPAFIPTLFVYDGDSTKELLAQDAAVPGGEGTVTQIKHIAIDGEGRLVVTASLVIETADGPRGLDAILRYTPGMPGVSWERLAGTPTPVEGDLAIIKDRVHVGRGGDVVFQGAYYEVDDPERGTLRTNDALIRVSAQGQMDILADISPPLLNRIEATHVTPDGVVFAAVTGFEDNSDGILRAAAGGSAETFIKEGDPGFGQGDFATAYAFDSSDNGALFVSGESSTGQVVVRFEDGASEGSELLSDQFTYLVDGEERVAEQLYFDNAGPFASNDGEVVCSRIDLDNPTDLGVVCVGEKPPAGAIEGEIVAHQLYMLDFERGEAEENGVSYEYWVDVDLSVSAGFWQADLDVVTDPPFDGEVHVYNRLDGMPETTCTPSNGRVRCGELVATDDLELQLRMVFIPTAPNRHDVTLMLRGSNDGPEQQLDEVQDTLLALEQWFEPIEDGTRCYSIAYAAEGAGQDAFISYIADVNGRSAQVNDAPSTYPSGVDDVIRFTTSKEGVNVQGPLESYWLRLEPVRSDDYAKCGPFREKCYAYPSETYELDTEDNVTTGACILDAQGKADCQIAPTSTPTNPSRSLWLLALLLVGWRVRKPRQR